MHARVNLQKQVYLPLCVSTLIFALPISALAGTEQSVPGELANIRTNPNAPHSGAVVFSPMQGKQAPVVLDLQTLNARLQKNPKDLDALNAQAVYYWGKNKYNLALADCKCALKIKPQWTVLENEGSIYTLLGMNKEAIACLQSASNLNPQYEPIYYNLSVAYQRAHDWNKTIEYCNRGVKLNPREVNYYFRRANAHRALHHPEQALADYKAAVKANPTDYWPAACLALYLGDLNRDQEAIKAYDQAIDLLKANTRIGADRKRAWLATLFDNRGVHYANLKKFSHAISDFDEAIAYNPKSPATYHNRAGVYMARGEKAKAAKDYDAAIALNPKDSYSYKTRSELMAQEGSLEQAMVDYEQSVRLDNAGVAQPPKQINASSYSSVLKGYNSLIALDKNNLDALYDKGLAEICLGNTKAGVDDLHKFLNLAPPGSASVLDASIWCSLGERELKRPEWSSRILSNATSAIRGSRHWPAPVIDYLRGDQTADQLLKLSASKHAETEARCVIGIDQLLKHNLASARSHLTWVTTNGDNTTDAYFLATYKLQHAR